MLTKEKLNPLLRGLLGSEELVTKWWQSPNKAFDNKPPCEVELTEVRDYLMWHCYGAGG